MGARVSRAAKAPLYNSESASGEAGKPVAHAVQTAVPSGSGSTGADALVQLILHFSANDQVGVELVVRQETQSIPEEQVYYRVQIEASSLSTTQPVNLILLPTDRRAQGELSHNVGDWMVPTEGAPKKPRSPGGRLLAKLSPRHKAKAPAKQEE